MWLYQFLRSKFGGYKYDVADDKSYGQWQGSALSTIKPL